MLFQYCSVIRKNKQNQRRSKKNIKRWVAKLSIACAHLGGPLKTGKRRTSQLRPNSWPRTQEMDFLGMWFEIKYCKIESKAKMKQHKKTRKLLNTLKKMQERKKVVGGVKGGMKSLVAGFGQCQCNAKWGIVAQQLFGFFEFLSPDPALCEPRLAVRLLRVYILYTYIIFILLVDLNIFFGRTPLKSKLRTHVPVWQPFLIRIYIKILSVFVLLKKHQAAVIFLKAIKIRKPGWLMPDAPELTWVATYGSPASVKHRAALRRTARSSLPTAQVFHSPRKQTRLDIWVHICSECIMEWFTRGKR